ncbi:MAG: tetratricopeptide repeat protein, partial [Acidobacteriia bacterium]|nr:tetratricopeptide repeat protein [Terriglobia bacterium]
MAAPSWLKGCCLAVVFIVFVPPAGAGAPPQPQPGESESGLRAAEACYEQKQYRQAERILKGILEKTPRHYAGNEIMALSLTAEGRDSAARSFFQTAAEAAPSSAIARANFAANLARLHENPLAEAEFAAALRLEPGNYEINHNFGEFYIALGQLAKAVPLLKTAQKVRADAYANGYDLALAELKSGMLGDADSQVRALLKLRETAELHSLLGDISERRGEFVEAAAELQRAAQMEPGEDHLFDWGAELLRHQTLDPAREVFTHGAGLYPRSWRMLVGLGVAQYLSGLNDPAAESFCRAIDLDPADARPYFFLARVRNISAPVAAQASLRFQKYIEVQPASAQARYYYAMSLLNWPTGGDAPDTAKIESLLRAALRLAPRMAEAHLQLGILYTQQHKTPEAIAELQQAVEDDPGLETAHYRLGQALMLSGHRDRGRNELAIWSRLHSHQDTDAERERRRRSR